MATSTSRTVPSSPNPSGQDSPRKRDWTSLRTGEPGSAFRGITRGRGSRGGGVRGGRGGGHPPTNSAKKPTSQPDSTNNIPSPSLKLKTPSVSRKPPASTSTTVGPNGASQKTVNGSVERGTQPKSTSRKQPRAVPAVAHAPVSPPETSQTAPPTPSRSNRRRRPQGKSTTAITKPSLPSTPKTQKSRGGSTPASQTIIRKDVPPHLAAAHQAEIRHDIDALVERVRAVAMAENRPTTPGSHIDWAGDEDDSLPDLDDWGVSTADTCPTIVTHDEDQSEEISPILADTLKPLPEPTSGVHQEAEREMETYDAQCNRTELLIKPTFLPRSPQGAIASSNAEEAPGLCIIEPARADESPSPTLPDARPPLHPSLPPKPVAAMESLRARCNSISKPSCLPPKPAASVTDEAFTTKTEGLAESMHAPSVEERLALERVSSASSKERGLIAVIHAPVPGLPESQSAPNLLSTSGPRTHSRSQTEVRSGSQQSSISHRRGRSGASSPLGRHVYTHTRNHSTPAGGAGFRQHASRPVITGEAMSRLARTIGGLGPAATRTQTISVRKDSTISS